MVLKKERPPGVGNSSNMSNEQPVLKRQRIENAGIEDETDEAPPDIIITATSSILSTSSSSSSSSSSLASTSSASIKVDIESRDELDKSVGVIVSGGSEFPDLLKLTNNNSTDNEMLQFQSELVTQCLCGVSERILGKPFQSHYSQDTSGGVKRIATLTEWPITKLLQFLSNLELLFDIYLKQNAKGNICGRIMDVCDALIRNEHNLIDEIIDLCDHNNKFVTFLAGRVLSSFLVIAKHNMEDCWLEKIINNLFSFERLDFIAVRKINFSLEIIKRIVQWKDIQEHPLDDEFDSDDLPATIPPIENNYFATRNSTNNEGSSGTTSGSSSNIRPNNNERSTTTATTTTSSSSTIINSGGCQMITLTDSESFDTTRLKCEAIKMLENKWPALVNNMNNLITSHREMGSAESCIVTFLGLWECLMSVDASLPVGETLPFYAQLANFELLLNQNLSCTIYKQILAVFNEALCYGSSLALQPDVPVGTCDLAHQIIRHVNNGRILESLPRRQPENPVALICYKGRTLNYEEGLLEISTNPINDSESQLDMDRTLLQKLVLLVLKSVAVTVKESRSDSSDSSFDSTDYDAYQDMVLIEGPIRNVLKKLENFIKEKLEFHPESHFSKILIYLFDDQEDYLIEAMICTLDVTSGISLRNNAFPELVSMLNPVFTFLEFLKMFSFSPDVLLDLLLSNETYFLLYILRFLKYIRSNWSIFLTGCHDSDIINNCLDNAMSVLIRLRYKISRMVSESRFPYDIFPVLRILECCEGLYEGNELT